MRVHYRVIGGFVPVARGCDLDTAAMARDDAAELETLIRTSGVMTPPILPHIRGADTRTYTIDVQDEGAGQRLTLDALQVWPSLRPLIGFLEAHSEDLLAD
jgi:Emfourin